jgi:hypothetical protein
MKIFEKKIPERRTNFQKKIPRQHKKPRTVSGKNELLKTQKITLKKGAKFY